MAAKPGYPGILALLLTGCIAAEAPKPVAGISPRPAVAESSDLDDMDFPFPFRGVTYRMRVAGGAEAGVLGNVEVTTDRPVDEATAKEAVLNACSFIGRFPDPATVGTNSSESWDWLFEHACL